MTELQPSSEELCEALRAFDTPTVSNAIEAFGVRDRTAGYASQQIVCAYPHLGSMVGYAVTCISDCTTGGPQRPSRYGDLLDALLAAPKPAVVVCQYVGSDRARGCFVGDMSAALFRRLGAVGVLTDAPNRDLAMIQQRVPGFHLFGFGAVASHGNGAILDVGLTVTIGGMVVRPGDLIHGDADGVITIPLEIADRVAEQAAAVHRAEQETYDMVTNPDIPLDVVKARFTH